MALKIPQLCRNGEPRTCFLSAIAGKSDLQLSSLGRHRVKLADEHRSHVSVTAERFPTTSSSFTADKERFSLWRDIGPVAHSWLGAVHERLNRFTSPQFKRWDSTSYVKERQLPLADLQTFLDEYVGMFAVKEYPYSPYGIPDGRTTLISQRCVNHKAVLESAGMETHRADLEIWVAQTLEHWMVDPTVPIGAKLVTTSPRGRLEEGYPGTKQTNYVFINIFEKVSPDIEPTGFRMIQVTSYDTHKALDVLQSDFETQLSGEPYQPLPLPLKPKDESHRLISQVYLFPPAISISSLTRRIQRNDLEHQAWPIHLKDLPQLNMREFNRQRDEVMQFCQTQFDQLVTKQTPETASQHFDLLIEVIRNWFLKWVELHATNYQINEESAKSSTFPTNLIDAISLEWQAEIAKREGQTLTSELRQTVKALKQQRKFNPRLPMGRLASMTHCIVGTPGSLAMKGLSLDKLSALKTGELLNPGATLSLSEVQAFQHYLDNLTKIEVLNRQTGQTETYYLPILDQQYVTDYQTGCYKLTSDGPLYGPCDILLSEDTLVDVTAMLTEEEYLRLRQALVAQKIEEAITEHHNLTPQDQERLHFLITKLTQKLFKVSLSGLIAGVVDYSESVWDLPYEYYQKLTASPSPLQTLEELLASLERDELVSIEETVVYHQAPTHQVSIHQSLTASFSPN